MKRTMNDILDMYKEEQEKNIQLKKQYEIMKMNAEFLIEKNNELNKTIKEVREYIENYLPNYDFDHSNLIKLLEIIDKNGGKE